MAGYWLVDGSLMLHGLLWWLMMVFCMLNPWLIDGSSMVHWWQTILDQRQVSLSITNNITLPWLTSNNQVTTTIWEEIPLQNMAWSMVGHPLSVLQLFLQKHTHGRNMALTDQTVRRWNMWNKKVKIQKHLGLDRPNFHAPIKYMQRHHLSKVPLRRVKSKRWYRLVSVVQGLHLSSSLCPSTSYLNQMAAKTIVITTWMINHWFV